MRRKGKKRLSIAARKYQCAKTIGRFSVWTGANASSARKEVSRAGEGVAVALLWAIQTRNVDEKSLDQEEPFHEYVAKRSQRRSGLRARPSHRGSEASSDNRDDERRQADGRFLERWASGSSAA